MAGGVEEILAKLLVPDNAVIQQATRELQAVYRDPALVPVLCNVLLNSQNPQIRQFAAVLLRKRLVKLWKGLPLADHDSIKGTLLQCMGQEKVHIVVVSIAHLVSVIAEHELARGPWDSLSQFIVTHCHSPEPSQREVGMLLLSSLMETAALELRPQFQTLLQLFSAALEDSGSQMVPVYALKALTAMVEYIADDTILVFTALIPKIIVVVKSLISVNEDKACEAMELFDVLVECEVAMVTPHLVLLIQFCLEIAANLQIGNNIRVKALAFISWLTTLKKKTLLRHNLLPTILQTMLTIMASPTDKGEEEEEEGVESQSPISLAAQVLDVLSLNLPPDAVFTPVLQLINSWVKSPNQFERAAALIAIAVMVEGCSDYVRKHHLPTLLQVVCQGTNDEEKVVRNAALFAVGQFSEHLQPEISQYSNEILPLLFRFVDHALSSPQQEGSGITKIFYALETFTEQLGMELVPYLPVLMDKLFLALSATDNVHIRELAISAIGAVANACRQNLLPYFPRIIETLKECVTLPYNPELSTLQAQAIDTLGTLARTVGEEHFRPLAPECIVLGMNLMQTNDPDLRRSVYGMFASVSCVLKEAMATHLDSIVKRMLESLVSEEGVKVHYATPQVSFLNFEENEEGEEAAEGGEFECSLLDDEEIEGYSVANAYLEEKEDTCNALGEIAENTGSHFIPYMDDCYREVNILTEHSAEGIRKASLWAVSRFCKVWYQYVISSGGDGKADVEILVNSTLLSMAATVRTDTERMVVLATLESLEELIKFLKSVSFPLDNKPLESLAISIQDVFEQKAQCQGEMEEEDRVHALDEMAEYDGMLVECTGNLVGPLAGLAGGEAFLPWLGPLLPPLIGRLNPDSSTNDRSFAVGTLAELVDGMGSQSPHLLHVVYPIFMKSLEDGDDEVCNNGVYGLGVLAANALPEISGQYTEILQTLFAVAHTRKEGRILDNVCGAVSRMIIANETAVPLEQVVPVLVQHLPLKVDMEENKTVYGCILHLFESKNPAVMAHLQPMLGVFAAELSPASKLSTDLQQRIAALVQALNSHCPAEMQVAVGGLTQDQLAVLNAALNS